MANIGDFNLSWRLQAFLGKTGDDLLLFGAAACASRFYLLFLSISDDLYHIFSGIEGFFIYFVVVHVHYITIISSQK